MPLLRHRARRNPRSPNPSVSARRERSCSRDLRAYSPKRRETVVRFMRIPTRIGGGICEHDPGSTLSISFSLFSKMEKERESRNYSDARNREHENPCGNRIDCPKDAGHSFVPVSDHCQPFFHSAWGLFILQNLRKDSCPALSHLTRQKKERGRRKCRKFRVILCRL